MPPPDPKVTELPASKTAGEAQLKTPPSTAINRPETPEFTFTFQALELLAQRLIAELEKPPEVLEIPLGKWKRFKHRAKNGWKGFVSVAKDVGPFFTGVASIATSIMIAFVTVTVTAGVAYFTYQLNKKQAEASRLSLQTAALADFIEADSKKRTVAAIKLASYGKEAFPFIKVALGLEDPVRSGGVQTLQMMYQTQPEIREALVAETLKNFKEGTPMLRFGVLSFYSAIALQLQTEHKKQFLDELKIRFEPNGSSCSKETGAFVQEAVIFFAACSLVDVKQVLLDIAQNCPHETATDEYEGPRGHAVFMLAELIEQQGLAKTERDEIIKIFRNLRTDASDPLKNTIDGAIKQIEKINGP